MVQHHDVGLLCCWTRPQDFSGALDVSEPDYNAVDPFDDAGELEDLFSPTTLFPVLVILMLFIGFAIAWIASLVVDHKNTKELQALHNKHVLMFGEVVPGVGREEVSPMARVFPW